MTKLADIVRGWKGTVEIKPVSECAKAVGDKVKSVGSSPHPSLQWKDCDPFDFESGSSASEGSFGFPGGQGQQLHTHAFQGSTNGSIDSVSLQKDKNGSIDTVNLLNLPSGAHLPTTLEQESPNPTEIRKSISKEVQSATLDSKSAHPVKLQEFAAGSLALMKTEQGSPDPFTLPLYTPFYDPSKLESLSGYPYPAPSDPVTSLDLHHHSEKNWRDWYDANPVHAPAAYKPLKDYQFPNDLSLKRSAPKSAALSWKADIADAKSSPDQTPCTKRVAEMADSECSICGNPVYKRCRHRLTKQDWLCGACYEYRAKRRVDPKGGLRPGLPKNGFVPTERALEAYNLPHMPVKRPAIKKEPKEGLADTDLPNKSLPIEHAPAVLPSTSQAPASPKGPLPSPLIPSPETTLAKGHSTRILPSEGRACANCHTMDVKKGGWHKKDGGREFLCGACNAWAKRHPGGEGRPAKLWNREKRGQPKQGGEKAASEQL